MSAVFLAYKRDGILAEIQYQFVSIFIAIRLVPVLWGTETMFEPVKNGSGATIGYRVHADEGLLKSINRVWNSTKYHYSSINEG